MLGVMLGLCQVYVRSENRETPLYRAFCRETVRSLQKSQNYHPTPASLTPPLRLEGSWLPLLPYMTPHSSQGRTPVALAAPHPSQGRGPGKGGGVKKNTATKQFIPMLGTKHSHVGNCHHQSLMLANQILLDVSPQAIQRVSTTDLPDPTDPRFLYLCSSISVRWLRSV